MIIRTTEELRLHLPNHAYSDLESMYGAFKRSEQDVLREVVGSALYAEVNKRTEALDITERHEWLIQEGLHEPKEGAEPDPWAELAYLCQQVIVFDAFMRSADINAISVNQSGINVVDAENYDAASKDGIANYKKQLNKELHAAINRLLVWLEELEKEQGAGSEGQEIIALWRQSKYYYKIVGLLVSTATQFNEYVDIYESRERFVNLVPDLKYCQRHFIENELGTPLLEDLLKKSLNCTANKEEQEAINRAQEALCLCVETRSKMFNRAEAKDEAIGAVKMMVDYVFAHIEAFDEKARMAFPQYDEAWTAYERRKAAEESGEVVPVEKPEPWVNNRRGNMMFVTPGIY